MKPITSASQAADAAAEIKDPGLRLAVKTAGSKGELARRLNKSRQTIVQWTRVPEHELLNIEREFGVPREKMRPELFRGFARIRPLQARA